MARSYDQMCPIARTLDLVGERWTLLILRELYFGRSRFTEIARGLPGVPARLLSERLKKLEAEGVVERALYSEHPLRAEYRLTQLGESLKPVLAALATWGLEHCLSDAEAEEVRRHLPPHVLAELPS